MPTISVTCVALVLYCFFVSWYLIQESWLHDQDSGFRKRVSNIFLRSDNWSLAVLDQQKWIKTIGTPPCTLRQPRVSVKKKINNFYFFFVIEWDLPRPSCPNPALLWTLSPFEQIFMRKASCLTLFVEQPRLHWIC